MNENKSLTILLADDDADDRELFADAVKETDERLNCIAVDGGQAAIDYLSDVSHPLPDYIFLDLRMPGMSGRACLDMIKKDDRLKHIPVIIYTTSDYVEDSKETIGGGATHFITKPDNPEEIYYILSMILNEKWT
jgi:CheY-like chemotaxis protein